MQQIQSNLVPKGSRSFRESVDDSVHRQDIEMWKRARLFVRNITSRYVNYTSQTIAMFERDLHNLWYLFIGAAKVTPTDEPTADRLAIQVLIAREIGPIRRILDGDAHSQIADIPIPPIGTLARMWVDLPFLATDLRAAWTEAMTKNVIPPDQLANLAGFTARLVAFGICEAELSQCGLLLLREALETPRQILECDTANNDNDNENDMPLSYFIPALSAWLRHGSYKLFSLSARGYASSHESDTTSDDRDQWVAAGTLLSASSLCEGRRVLGFSMNRWEFWKQRLTEVAGQSGPLEKSVQGQARHCFNFLDSWERTTGGESHNRELARKVYFDIED
jgi:hypothetical protein